MPTEQVVEVVRLAASPQAGDRAELMARLSALVPASTQLRVEAIAKFFQLLGQVPVEEDRLADRFAQIAGEHRRLLEDVKSLRISDPEVQALRQQATAALEIADHSTASAKLAQARTIVSTKRETLARILDNQKREEATLVFEQARVEAGHLAYEQAAQLFAEAAGLLPERDVESRWHYIMQKANAEWMIGDLFGRNEALMQAVASYRAALPLAQRTRRPFDRAATQHALGTTLLALGERESGTERLEEAIAAFRAALKEYTRERLPLEWARTQTGIGVALYTLGEHTLGQREGGTIRFAEAVAAFRAGLEEATRERAPLDWAKAQSNLGNALAKWGTLESGTARLEKAVTAYRAALEERTRTRWPREWAATQVNLGGALAAWGLRESGTARLEEAVTAYRAALEENTHERVPLEWAKTQVGLGMALYSIGERESGTARLEQAAAAFRAALEENTRERVPLEWARTYTNLGNALLVWGSRESETARLKDAVTAYSAALEENTRERVPLDWATAFGMQGAARMNLAARTKDTEVAERALLQEIALQQIKEAFDAMRAAGHPDAAHFEALLSGASQFRASTTPPPTIHHKLAPTINNKTISIMKSMTGRPR